jgi:drug/metabolite transporter (DMT)-like permease
VRARRWSATILGFVGVLIILRPGFLEVTPEMALPVVAAAFMATAVLIVKSLSRTEAAGTVVIYMNLILTPLSLVPALFVWRWPTSPTWLHLMLLGLFAALAHLALTRAYAKADASAVLPFDYARLPLIAIIAYFAFGEVPGVWTWIGATVIVASAIYIVQRESKMPRRQTSARAVGQPIQNAPSKTARIRSASPGERSAHSARARSPTPLPDSYSIPKISLASARVSIDS